MTNNDELLIDVLRAAGHEDAADLASKLMAPRQAPPADEPAAVTPRAPTVLGGPMTQADIESESAYMLDEIKRMRAGR